MDMYGGYGCLVRQFLPKDLQEWSNHTRRCLRKNSILGKYYIISLINIISISLCENNNNNNKKNSACFSMKTKVLLSSKLYCHVRVYKISNVPGLNE